jgi:hypothetical protein
MIILDSEEEVSLSDFALVIINKKKYRKSGGIILS